MGTTPWSGMPYTQDGPDNPAVYVSWYDVQAMVHVLNEAAGDSLYRLPTEAEWEYACRANATTAWSFGDSEDALADYVWCWGNSWSIGLQYAQRVGLKRPNRWGLYDMHGNVWEWVQDGWRDYTSEPQTDPQAPMPTSVKIIRGGAGYYDRMRSRSAQRSVSDAGTRYSDFGVRLVRLASGTANQQPQSAAGADQTVTDGATVQLDGTASADADGDSLTYRWSSPPGTNLSDSTAARPTFRASAAGDYTFVLVVNDGTLDSAPDTVVISVLQDTSLWQFEMVARNNRGGVVVLRLGWADNATDGIDAGLGESELPPPPPLPGFDARWAVAGLYGVRADYRSAVAARSGAVWNLRLQSDDARLPLSLSWDAGALPSEGAFQLVDAATGGQVTDLDLRTRSGHQVTTSGVTELQVRYTPVITASHTYGLPDGWSMVSLPVAARDRSLRATFPSALSLFGFSNGYQSENGFRAGVGYWVNLPSPTEATITGPVYGDTALVCRLPARWSMVAPGNASLDVAALKAAYPTLLSVFGYAEAYEVATTMAPGKAYWVNLSAASVLDLSGGVARPAAAKPPLALPTWTGPVLYAEGSGGCQQLQLGVPASSVVELPPVPPAGLFDVRVDVALGISSWQVPAGPEAYRVRVQGNVEHLRWQGLPALGWDLVVDGTTVPLVGSGVVALSASSWVTLRPRAGVPAATQLRAAYPNPFNPATTIRYDLAQAAVVRLSIYAVSGQLVRQLVSVRQEAGAHQIEWDGRDGSGCPVGNGVYLCELQADAHRAVRRMVLIK